LEVVRIDGQRVELTKAAVPMASGAGTKSAAPAGAAPDFAASAASGI
jgi:hypothetical protein